MYATLSKEAGAPLEWESLGLGRGMGGHQDPVGTVGSPSSVGAVESQGPGGRCGDHQHPVRVVGSPGSVGV